MLTREQILEVNDGGIVEINVPEWGGSVGIRILTGRERDAFEASMQDKSSKARLYDFRARYSALVLCDADGKKLFEPSDVAQLTEKSAAALDRIVSRAMQINGVSDKDVEELEGNSDAGQSAGSGSD